MSWALFSAIGYFISKDGISKLRYYWLVNTFALSNAPLIYLTMSCDMLWFFKIYFAYVGLSILFLLTTPKAYKVYISRKYGVEGFKEMENLLRRWSKSTKAKLFIFGSAIPKAFTVGREVFISAGMIDLLDNEELKAVIAHEAFHVKQNRYPFLSNFKILTFIYLPDTKLEALADSYAENIVGKKPLISAKRKIKNFYLDRS